MVQKPRSVRVTVTELMLQLLKGGSETLLFLLFLLIFGLSVGRREMLETGLIESAQLWGFDLIHCALIDPSHDGDWSSTSVSQTHAAVFSHAATAAIMNDEGQNSRLLKFNTETHSSKHISFHEWYVNIVSQLFKLSLSGRFSKCFT